MMSFPVELCPKWVKNDRGLKDLFIPLRKYKGQKISLVFKDNIFQESIDFTDFFQDVDVQFEKIIFENTTFKEYVRFIDIQCDELEFLFVKFEKGGALKNRNGKHNLDIGTLIFRPFQVENDFVIDIGNCANNEGFLETEKIGRIQNIEFENHKEGNGQVYFVGINQYTEQADFRNRILDKVSFQNCNLSNCYFLNAKVDKTEFRNCVFPEIKNHLFVNLLDSKAHIMLMPLFTALVPTLFFMLWLAFLDNQILILASYFFMMPFLIVLWLASFNAISHPLEHIFSGFLTAKKENVLNQIENFHHHFGVKDEQVLNKFLNELKVDVKNLDSLIHRNKLQESYLNLIELYRQLKENFDKNDFQTAGNFFYSQRYLEMITTTRKKSWLESWILNVHYMVNGFGERFMRPLTLWIATVILFSILPYFAPSWIQKNWLQPILVNKMELNRDYVATPNTPKFLLLEQNLNEQYALFPNSNDKNQSYYPIVVWEMDNNATQIILNGEKIDKEVAIYISTLKNDWQTRFYYSLSHMILPFASENRQWFKEVSQKAIFFGYLESALLWLFSGAFVLALYHRIKR